jgi:hypothetical protein
MMTPEGLEHRPGAGYASKVRVRITLETDLGVILQQRLPTRT